MLKIISSFNYNPNNMAKKTLINLFFKENQAKWETVDEGIQRQIVGFEERIMMVNVKFEKGAIGALHHHHHTQITYVAEGLFEVTIDNDKQVLKKGDSFFIPTNTTHGVTCIEPGILVDVFSPMREDFIK
jgi:quercetin dioxygenase-like cupin family protein